MKLSVTHHDLVEQAEREIETLSPAQAETLLGDAGVCFVDLRDFRELQREGRIPDAFNAPRGMLEFWVDPSSPYHKPVFGEARRLVFYCQSGWRSALATKTVQDMGMTNVCHIGGGLRAWKEAGLPTEELPPRKS